MVTIFKDLLQSSYYNCSCQISSWLCCFNFFWGNVSPGQRGTGKGGNRRFSLLYRWGRSGFKKKKNSDWPENCKKNCTPSDDCSYLFLMTVVECRLRGSGEEPLKDGFDHVIVSAALRDKNKRQFKGKVHRFQVIMLTSQLETAFFGLTYVQHP